MQHKLNLIAAKAASDRKCKFTSLVHLVNAENLKRCFAELKPNKAAGIDSVTKATYQQKLDGNIEILISKLKSKEYRSKPVRRVFIPKPGKNEKRALGIPCIEEKMLQNNVKKILESIFEADFLECSYGFRPGRNCHAAIKALNSSVMTKPVNYVVEVDIRKFFDEVRQDWMIRFLKERIADPNLLWLIEQFLKAGVMESGKYLTSELGAAQGNTISPILSNVYLHYVLDLWFEKVIRPKARGYMKLIRYCDDFVICCESQKDAKEFLDLLRDRLAKFGLNVSEAKTRIVTYGKQEWRLAHKEGRKAETFNFLGFTHYGKCNRRGYWVAGHKTSKEGLARKLKAITEYIKAVCCMVELQEWWKILKAKVAGHINYFGVSGNYNCLVQFRTQATKMAYKWINRRSQRKSMNWNEYNRYLEYNPLPAARICFKLY